MTRYLTEAIRGAAACLIAAEEAICKKVDLSIEQWNALMTIGRSTRALSVSQLAHALKHSRQSTYELALGLERAGLIRLLRNPDDRRLLQMEITETGRRDLAIAEDRRNAWFLTMTYDLEESDLYVLTERMRALRNRIERARPFA
jgi:DNA-binding MarR family transcriptional regulator